MQFISVLPAGFPTREFFEIAARLNDAPGLVFGYIHGGDGIGDLSAWHAQHAQGYEVILLPDRSIVSNVFDIVRNLEPKPLKGTRLFAAQLMAFAHLTDMTVDPALALHEVASKEGNHCANQELAAFQAAYNAPSDLWIASALGECVDFPQVRPVSTTDHDLALLLAQWRRNYIAALEIARISLTVDRPGDRLSMLMRWMDQEFSLRGSALVWALKYFQNGPGSREMFKKLGSDDRELAISGVKSDAWDVTYLSEFVRRVEEGEKDGKRYVFATSDSALADVANAAVPQQEAPDALASWTDMCMRWWGDEEARAAADQIKALSEVAGTRPALAAPAGASGDHVGYLIARAEQAVREWRPNHP